MVCVQLGFPLGMYHALAEGEKPEWAPSPARLLGALLAAAEEVPSDDTAADRAVLQRLCEARPPTIHAPPSVPAAVQSKEPGAGPTPVAELRGASRWAPRNPGASELKKDLPGPRTVNVAEVNKGGVAIGELPVRMTWPELELSTEERQRLRRLLAEVAWLGTSRSPVICRLLDDGPAAELQAKAARWSPLPWGTLLADAQIRVPGAGLIQDFDRAFEARRAREDRVEAAGKVPPARANPWPYEVSGSTLREDALDPGHWGRIAIVKLDGESEMTPRASGAYLAARAFRAALMDAFADRGETGEAPELLHGRGDRPHLAIVPLPFAGQRHGDGRVLGFALLYPHPRRAPAVEAEAREVESSLARFFPGAGDRRAVRVPDAGSFLIEPAEGDHAQTLGKLRYVGPSRHWASVTPVVHSRWRKGDDRVALAAQVDADCAHVGLPAPVRIERLRSSALRGGGNRIVPGPSRLRPEWRQSVQGPRSHLRLEFDRPVLGPIALGKARHFGLGLCIPVDAPEPDE